jgi:hypothetical protein
MIESLLILFGVRSQCKILTVEQDPLLRLINTKLSFGTDSLLRDIIFLALHAPNPKSITHRIMVQSLTQVEHVLPPPHEGVVAELIDLDRPDAEPLIMFLGRTVSANRPHPDYFSSHPNSDTVLESIVHTLKETPSSIMTSLTKSGSNDSLSSLSSFDFTRNTSPSYHPIIDELESDRDHESKRNASTSFDAATLAGPQVLHTSTQSTRTPYHAEDRFYGSQIAETYMPFLHNLYRIRLEPGTLSLFDLAVLADCVHNHDPLYSLLEHHGYWFVQIICALVEKLYPCTTIRSKRYAPVSEDTIRIPANDYLPELEGRSMRILVSRVEEAVVSLVASEFEVYKGAKLEEVHIFH